MAVLQGISVAPCTFAELADLVFSICTRPFTKSVQRVDVAADTYPDVSIKEAERNQCAKTGGLLWIITNGLQKCPARRKQFLCERVVHEWQCICLKAA